MVVIDLETIDDAQVIFETLNARGTRLSESDLIKNFVLYRAAESGLNAENLYRQHWSTLEDEWWREDVRQGRLVRPRLDVFLNYWLSTRTATDVPGGRVFGAFRTYVENRDIDTVALDISTMGATYRAIDGVRSPAEAKFIYRWRVMDAGVVTPVLLLLFSAASDRLSPARRLSALRAIESFLIRRMVCRLTTKDYNRLFLDLAQTLQEQGPDRADEIVSGFLRGQTAESRAWPTDAQFQDALLNLPLYRLLTRGRLRLLLEGVEEALRTTKAEEQDVSTNLTIEHIMPQAWQAHWPLNSNDGDDEQAAERRDRMVHTLGNLTLVTKALNPSMSNAAWSDKRAALEAHSVLFLNKELLTLPVTAAWDEDSIHGRGKRLAHLATQVWS